MTTNYDHMDSMAKVATQYAEASGDSPPMTHSCIKCGKETLSYSYCGDCNPLVYQSLLDKGLTEQESNDQLMDLEVESWYVVNGL